MATIRSSRPYGSFGLRPKALSDVMRAGSAVRSTPSRPGSRKLQRHCSPLASTTAASAGTVTYSFHAMRPGASIPAMPIAVQKVSLFSSRAFSGS
jgi:hypothetical protein